MHRLPRLLLTLALSSFVATSAAWADEPARVIKVGIIGLDTSHVVAFTKAMNDPKATGEMATVEVVAAYPGGSSDIPDSANRLEGFTKQLRDMGVEIVDSIDTLLTKVDAVLLESVDGRPHLEQVKPVIKARKPVFIDKPMAGSLADAIEIFRLAKEANVPCFSSSSLRFSASVLGARKDEKIDGVLGCDVYGPCTLEPHHPDLFWYGIHGVETLFTIMGAGCVSVSRVHTQGTDLVTGEWNDGRLGTFRGVRSGKSGYGGTIFGKNGVFPVGKYDGYQPLVVEIARFFHSGKPPVSAEETIEMFAFMEAADESKRQGGKTVTLESVLAKAKQTLAAGK
jgi:predicted dehydrogenase